MFEWTKSIMGHWGETDRERRYTMPTGTFVSKSKKNKRKSQKQARKRNRK